MGGSVPLIVEMHAEDAAILWLQRNRAVDAPHFDKMRLARLDERLEANLDGLRVAGLLGWELARAAYDTHPEPGEVFTLATLAFGAGSARGIGEVLEIVDGDTDGALTRAAVSGLGWLDPAALRGLVQPLLNDSRPTVRALGLGACAVHRVDPGAQLVKFLDDEVSVRRQALKVAGLMNRSDIRFEQDDDEECRFRSAWAQFRMGDRDHAEDMLWDLAYANGPFQMKAFELVALGTETEAARNRLRDAGPLSEPLAVRLAGRIGDAEFMPWLLSKMDGPLAAIAGESFSMITGADLAFLDLDGPPMEETGPNDDPSDPLVEVDPNDDLPVPDREKVRRWWENGASSFAVGESYFLGQKVSDETYEQGFRTGFQRQRRVAALALACRRAGPMLNWRARQHRIKGPFHRPGYWQVVES